MDVFRRYTFDAAHHLPNVPEGHKCGRLHGHTYRVEVRVTGDVDERTGWVMDFADIDAVARPLVDRLDHRCLNDIADLHNPTSENVARWLWWRIKPTLPGLSAVTVRETPTSGVTYHGEPDEDDE